MDIDMCDVDAVLQYYEGICGTEMELIISNT